MSSAGSQAGGQGQVPNPSQDQVSSPNTPTGQVPGGNATQPSQDQLQQQQPGPTQGITTLEQALDALQRARGDAAKYRTKLDEIDAARVQAERAKMDVTQRLQAELDDAKKALEATRANARKNALAAAVRQESSELGIIDPEVAILLCEAKGVEYDEHDAPSNIKALLREIVQSKKHLVSAAQASANSSPTNPQRAPAGTLIISKAQLNDMKFHEEFKKQHGMPVSVAASKGLVRVEG